MRSLRILPLLVVAAALQLAGTVSAQIIVLKHATLIDGSGAGGQKDFALAIENGRIREIGSAGKLPAPVVATVVELRGKFIVPGIINAHGHVGANTEPQLRQYALYV